MEMSEGMRSSEVEESIFHPRKDGGGIMMILLFLESARTMARDGERGERREREREKKINCSRHYSRIAGRVEGIPSP